MFFEIFFIISILSILSFFQISIFQNILKDFYFSKIYYEESSWFDLKAWQKLSIFLRKDNFFSKQKIKQLIKIFWKKQKILSIFFLFFFPILLSLTNLL